MQACTNFAVVNESLEYLADQCCIKAALEEHPPQKNKFPLSQPNALRTIFILVNPLL